MCSRKNYCPSMREARGTGRDEMREETGCLISQAVRVGMRSSEWWEGHDQVAVWEHPSSCPGQDLRTKSRRPQNGP